MRVYHTTQSERASEILRNGFRDTSSNWRMRDFSGALFADKPLSANDGCAGNTVLSLELDEPVFVRLERKEGDGYRWAVIPTDVLNHFGNAKAPKVHARPPWPRVLTLPSTVCTQGRRRGRYRLIGILEDLSTRDTHSS
jgi:hypothetical protein